MSRIRNILILIRNTFEKLDLRIIILIPGVLGFICVLWIMNTGSIEGKPIQDSLFSLTFFFWGCMGIPMILRKEYPIIRSIRITGLWAVIHGIVILTSGWLIAFMSIFFHFFHYK